MAVRLLREGLYELIGGDPISTLAQLCGSYSECGKRVDTTSFMLDLFDYDLPLGWLLDCRCHADSRKGLQKVRRSSTGSWLMGVPNFAPAHLSNFCVRRTCT